LAFKKKGGVEGGKKRWFGIHARKKREGKGPQGGERGSLRLKKQEGHFQGGKGVCNRERRVKKEKLGGGGGKKWSQGYFSSGKTGRRKKGPFLLKECVLLSLEILRTFSIMWGGGARSVSYRGERKRREMVEIGNRSSNEKKKKELVCAAVRKGNRLFNQR